MKKIISILCIFAVVIVSGFNILRNENDHNVSDLLLSNIDALADPNEGGGTYERSTISYYNTSEVIGGIHYECSVTVYGCVGTGSMGCAHSYSRNCWEM